MLERFPSFAMSRSTYGFFVFVSVAKVWSQPMHMNLGLPSPRAAHAMCSIDRNIYIFGGRDTEKRQNDLHIFNVGKK